MKYTVEIKVEDFKSNFVTTVEAPTLGLAKTFGMVNFLKNNKLSGNLVMYKVKDENGNVVLNQF